MLLTICFQGRVVRRFRGAFTLWGAIAPPGLIISDRLKQGGGEASKTYIREISNDPLASGFISCFGITQDGSGGGMGVVGQFEGNGGGWGLLLVELAGVRD